LGTFNGQNKPLQKALEYVQTKQSIAQIPSPFMIAPIQFYLTGTISSIVFILLIKTVLPIKSFQFSILSIILNDKLKKDMIAQNTKLKNLETITNPSKSVT